MLEFLKNYYVFMLILLVISYLVPKEFYKKYMQFYIGIFAIELLLKPVLEFFTMNNPSGIYEMFSTFNQQLEQLEVELGEGETIYEYFFFEGEGK